MTAVELHTEIRDALLAWEQRPGGFSARDAATDVMAVLVGYKLVDPVGESGHQP